MFCCRADPSETITGDDSSVNKALQSFHFLDDEESFDPTSTFFGVMGYESGGSLDRASEQPDEDSDSDSEDEVNTPLTSPITSRDDVIVFCFHLDGARWPGDAASGVRGSAS